MEEFKNVLFGEDKIFIIPTIDKPVKFVCSDRYNIEETEDGLEITEKISLQEVIRRVEAAGNDPNEVMVNLIRDGKWSGMIV